MISIIRSGQVVSKILKGKAKTPTLIIEGRNGEKWPLPLSTQTQLEEFMLGQEIRVCFEDVPHVAFEEPKVEALPVPVATSNPVTCPKGVLPDELGESEVCPGCEHMKATEELGLETSCDLTKQTGENKS